MNPSHYLLLFFLALFFQLQTSNAQLVPLNSNCSYYKANMKCGTNAVCGAGDLCRCKFGYLPIGPDNIHCSVFKCSNSTDDCVRHFGANTKCGHAKGNYCDCDFGNSSSSDVFFDKQVQRCVHRHELTRIDCSSNANCGRGMFCGSGEKSCRCKYGYKLNRNGYDCDQIKCSRDSDCKPPNWIEIIPRRRCSILNKVCECTSDYGLNEQTQECEWKELPKPVVKPEVKVRKDVKGNGGFVSGMQIFFIILVILLVVVACCICKAVSGKTTTSQYPRRHNRYEDCTNTNDYSSSSYNNTTELFTISSSSHDYSSCYQANDYSCTDNDTSTTHYNHEANDNSMPSYDDV